MMDRRQFLSAAVACGATLARGSSAFAAQASKYELLIRGGRVIDPSVHLDAVRDVAITGGRIHPRRLRVTSISEWGRTRAGTVDKTRRRGDCAADRPHARCPAAVASHPPV